MSDEPRFCKDCKWAVLPENPAYAKCHHSMALDPEKSTDYLVSGEGDQTAYRYCATMRQSFGACGPEGKLWEPRV